MKKYVSFILSLVLVLNLSVLIFAGPDNRQTNLSYIFDKDDVPVPIYTVVIPATLELKLYDDVKLIVNVTEMQEVRNMGMKIEITLEDALIDITHWNSSNPRFFVVKNPYTTGYYYESLNYRITTPYFDSTNLPHGIDGAIGAKLLEFKEEDSQPITFSKLMNSFVDPNKINPNSPYTGWIIFGIKLVDA